MKDNDEHLPNDGNLLNYQGIPLSRRFPGNSFFFFFAGKTCAKLAEIPELMSWEFPEISEMQGTDYTWSLPKEKLHALPGFLAEAYRAASLFQLQLYPDVRNVLTSLKSRFRMGAVSDGQSVWAVPELYSVGLSEFFDPVIISSDFGYRKPDERMFVLALKQMNLTPAEVLFIGNDMYRDVYGGHRLGMKTIFFRSNEGEQRKMGAEPDYLIFKFSELPEAIRFLTS